MISGLEIFDKVEVIRDLAPVAAGSADITTATGVPCTGRNVFGFIVGFGAITAGAVTSIELHGSDDNGSNYSLMKDDAGNDAKVIVADDDDNKVFLLQVVKPIGSVTHIKPVIKRATQNSVVDLVLALVGNTRVIPVTQGATVAGNDKFIGCYVP